MHGILLIVKNEGAWGLISLYNVSYLFLDLRYFLVFLFMGKRQGKERKKTKEKNFHATRIKK